MEHAGRNTHALKPTTPTASNDDKLTKTKRARGPHRKSSQTPRKPATLLLPTPGKMATPPRGPRQHRGITRRYICMILILWPDTFITICHPCPLSCNCSAPIGILQERVSSLVFMIYLVVDTCPAPRRCTNIGQQRRTPCDAPSMMQDVSFPFSFPLLAG